MILAKLNKWDDKTGIIHTSTSWQLASDDEFTNIVHTVDKSTTMLNLYYSTVEVPEDTTYYIRAKRIFGDGSESEWCDYIEVTNIEQSYSNMLLGKDPTISHPYVYVTEDQVRASSSKLTITTSSFQSNTDTHEATHWFVYDQNDNILYANIHDTKNLTSITMENLLSFKQKEKLRFLAIHRGTTGVESKAATKVIRMADDYGFRLKTNLSSVAVLETLSLVFEETDAKLGMYINRIELAKFDTDETITTLTKTGTSTWVIPYYYLRANAKYLVKVFTNNAYGTELDTIYYTLQVADIKKVVVKDDEYAYYKEIVRSQVAVTSHNTIPDGIYSEATYNNVILIPDSATQKMKMFQHIKENDTYRLDNIGRYANGINLPHAGPYENMCIKVINNKKIFIDMLNENGKPTFYVYSYDSATDSYTLTGTLTRDDEQYPLGKSFALAQISTEEIIYNPYGTAKLRKFNFNGTLVNLEDIPLTNITKAVVIRCRNNRLFIGNGTTYDAVMFNYEKLEYEKGYSFGPNSFINTDVRCIPLINGSTLLVKYDLDNIDTDGSLAYFNYETGTIETLHIPFPGVLPTSGIIWNTGEILCTYPASAGVQNYAIFR